ncbi:hypothetical protein B9T31_15940 [Acinetobacter sp. ANC 4558]|uniref:hypothetical protein n=1 Tax=Acinetobacter sp. ANC 4558 TaxID=1977876 RepID=UPI000A351E6B|nr:hypothetical protein [Acinetobacter sp. ANC 4558]OTG80791.1 hypothetical protein B9T31_15940 [Acinetobacter sp. ANC 4558]
MKNLIYLLIISFLLTSCSRTSKIESDHDNHDKTMTYKLDGWSSQKTPTGVGLSCTACENQVMISIDIVPIDKNNQYTKSNTDFINYLMLNKDDFAKKMASDAAVGGKIKLIKADKAKINNKEVFRYMFTSDDDLNNSFDNTSLFLHNDKLIKITLNYYDGYFSEKDRNAVDHFYNSIKFNP